MSGQRDAFAEFARNVSAIWQAASAAADAKREDVWAKATDDPDAALKHDPEHTPYEDPTAADMRKAADLLKAASGAIRDYRAFLIECGLWEEFLQWRLRRAAGR